MLSLLFTSQRSFISTFFEPLSSMGRSQPAKGSNLGGKVDGWDIAVRAERPNIPVIYASANPVKEERKVPGSAFFDKPYLSSANISALMKWLMK